MAAFIHIERRDLSDQELLARRPARSMRLDASKLNLNNPRVHRTDKDFAVAWAKMYGKGRVYYTTLGHVEENWDNPQFQKMITEAIRWALGLVNADITPRPLPSEGSFENEPLADAWYRSDVWKG